MSRDPEMDLEVRYDIGYDIGSRVVDRATLELLAARRDPQALDVIHAEALDMEESRVKAFDDLILGI